MKCILLIKSAALSHLLPLHESLSYRSTAMVKHEAQQSCKRSQHAQGRAATLINRRDETDDVILSSANSI